MSVTAFMRKPSRLVSSATVSAASRERPKESSSAPSGVALMKSPPVLHRSAAASMKRTGGTPPRLCRTVSSVRPVAICFVCRVRCGRAGSAAIVNHLHALDRDESLGYQLVEHGQERLDLLKRVNDLYDHRHVLRQAQYLRRVYEAVPAESHHAAQDGRARKPRLPRLQNDLLVERSVPASVALADEDAQQVAFFGDVHQTPPSTRA